MSYIGTTEIGQMFIGEIEIDKAYLGSELVFSSVPPRPRYTMTFCPSSYDTINSVYRMWNNANPARNGYAYADSTTYAGTGWTNGAYAETKVYWKFNTSSLPVDAEIISVSMQAKAMISWLGYQNRSPYLVVCDGITEKGARKTGISKSAQTFTLDTGSGWTRDLLQNISLLYYTQRDSTSTYQGWQQFFGATLTVEYYLEND